MPRRPPLVAAALVATVALAAGCSANTKGALLIEPVKALTEQQVTRCASILQALPDTLAKDVERREVVPDARVTAAWGDPVIALRCGVPEGRALDEPYRFDGVTWAMHDSGDSRTWTTRGQPVNLEVRIPDAYDAQAELLGSMATAITTSP